MSEPAPATPSNAARHPLFACMIGLVLANLVFVQLTEAASIEWLAPLYVLTLAAPFLARFKESRHYRTLWNLGVLAFFAVLVQHAWARDLASVLTDGLVLAVLCQVHLLNNLHADQRPDLLFLNSYLIAVITGYISVDLGFAVAFLLYVPFYVVGLGAMATARNGHSASPDETRALVLDGAKRSCVLIAVAMLAFLFWPRDFEREALLVEYFDLPNEGAATEIDFTTSLDLERNAGAHVSDAIAFTVVPASGDVADVPALWRGAVLESVTREGSWRQVDAERPFRGDGVELGWELDGDARGMARPAAPGEPDERDRRSARLAVVRAGGRTLRLFAPLEASRVELDDVHRAGVLELGGAGTARYSNQGELRYDVTVADGATFIAGERIGDTSLVEVVDSYYTRSAIGFAERLRGRLGESATAVEVAASFVRTVRTNYGYTSPGSPDGAETLHQFLTTEVGGHCEFFASALAVMLRSVGVPARVVTGYRAHAIDDTGERVIVRAMDAHAWVEVLDEAGRWHTFDPTPAVDGGQSGPGFLEIAGRHARDLWAAVTGFDAEARAALFRNIGKVPGLVLGFVKARPWSSSGCGIASLAFGWVLWSAWRRRRSRWETRSARALDRAFRRAGVVRQGSETPREVLSRVRGPSEFDEYASLALAVASHERERYAANGSRQARR